MLKRVTLKEVAARASVSYQTVSKVINAKAQVSDKTEQRIWKAIEELGYTPSYAARSLRLKRSNTIGYSWEPSPPDQTNPILDEFLQSMFRTAEESGYYLLCFPYHSEVNEQLDIYRELIDTERVDAFVLSVINYNDPCVKYLLGRNFPFVAFGRLDEPVPFPYIDIDGGMGLRLAVEHLVANGHQKIAALAWPADSRVGNHRMEGYFSAMKAAGLNVQPDWIQRGDGKYEVGFEATLALLDLPESIRPTAIVAMNDLMAIGAMAALRQKGLRAGKDVAVTGFDDTPTARFTNPPLTSLSQPVSMVGQILMERLISYLETGVYPEPMGELIAPKLVVRESTTGKAME